MKLFNMLITKNRKSNRNIKHNYTASTTPATTTAENRKINTCIKEIVSYGEQLLYRN